MNDKLQSIVLGLFFLGLAAGMIYLAPSIFKLVASTPLENVEMQENPAPIAAPEQPEMVVFPSLESGIWWTPDGQGGWVAFNQADDEAGTYTSRHIVVQGVLPTENTTSPWVLIIKIDRGQMIEVIEVGLSKLVAENIGGNSFDWSIVAWSDPR